jgi:hypothetical protein
MLMGVAAVYVLRWVVRCATILIPINVSPAVPLTIYHLAAVCFAIVQWATALDVQPMDCLAFNALEVIS